MIRPIRGARLVAVVRDGGNRLLNEASVLSLQNHGVQGPSDYIKSNI